MLVQSCLDRTTWRKYYMLFFGPWKAFNSQYSTVLEKEERPQISVLHIKFKKWFIEIPR